ncbi:unnamed protein product [Mytilus coruscus]|uniref:DUF5641 domain-containing protein n=1 Tax=Mytilus coruscus TaxID=42192 RepID=A0A6J7ZW04_MYTCO|nr:unnamed protein product [Mytilus coruscus]
MSSCAQQEVTIDTTQILSTHSVTQEINTIFDIDRFYSFKKVLRVTAYVQRFIAYCRSRQKRTGNLYTQEIRNVTLTLIQDVQQRHFCEVKQRLQKGETKTHNLVKQLKLYLDKDNLIRCEGRIHNAPLDESTKFPILLPAKDKLTKIIIMDAHITHLHSSTVTLLRQAYWIPTIRQVANKLLKAIVTEVETILNDCPLTYVSSDPLDEPLTPSYLLYGRRITTLPYPDNRDFEHSTFEVTHESVNKLSRLKSHLIQQFWYKWKHEYLTSLREYHLNTGKDNHTINVGDVVHVYEESPRTKWNLAVIVQLNIGGDGKTRSAVKRTKKNGLTSRPITKLYPQQKCQQIETL